MSTTLADLLHQLWVSQALKRDALVAADSLDSALRKRLQDFASLLASRVALRAHYTREKPFAEAEVETPMSNERLGGLLELLTLVAFHSDTLLYLPHAEREARLAHWAERTGFDLDIVREAAALGPAGIDAFVKRAAQAF